MSLDIFIKATAQVLRAPEKLTGNIPISASKIPCKESSTGSTKAANQKDIEGIMNNKSRYIPGMLTCTARIQAAHQRFAPLPRAAWSGGN